jgi:hypothetical protein
MVVGQENQQKISEQKAIACLDLYSGVLNAYWTQKKALDTLDIFAPNIAIKILKDIFLRHRIQCPTMVISYQNLIQGTQGFDNS